MRLIKVFGRPIAFHRCFVDITGSALDALFLSQCMYWTETLKEERDGWFYKTAEEWHEETGMTRRELETARKSLKEKGILQEKRAGVPCVVHYRINLATLQTGLHETYKLDCSKRADLFAGNEQTPIRAETSTKNTTESKAKGTLSEISDFCIEIGLPLTDAEWFYHKCEGNGWLVAGKPIKDWKAAIRSWKAAKYMPSQKQTGYPNANGNANHSRPSGSFNKPGRYTSGTA